MHSRLHLTTVVEDEIVTIETELAARRELIVLAIRIGSQVDSLLVDLEAHECHLSKVLRWLDSVVTNPRPSPRGL
jgi:hypothetical protein